MITFLVTLFVLCQTPAYTFFDTYMYPCSSAMVCVDIAKCNKIGVITTNDVILSEADELFRTPLLPCRKSDGDQGVCCRDPNYKDDWPTDVKYYDQKGQYTPQKSNTIVNAESKTTEVKDCTPPAVKLPNGKCGKVESGSAFSSEQIPAKSVSQYLPPVTEKPCPSGTVKEAITGRCEPLVEKKETFAEKIVPTKAPLQYLPPVTEKPCPSGTIKDAITGKCEPVIKTETPAIQSVKETASARPALPVLEFSPVAKIEKVAVTPVEKDTIKYLPPPASQVKQISECGPNESRLPNGECGKPSVIDVPCPPGTSKTANGCEAILQIKIPQNMVKPTLPSYMADRTYLPPPQVKAAEENIVTKEAGTCSRGKIIEHNDKRFCCEQIS